MEDVNFTPEQKLIFRLIGEVELLKGCVLDLMASQRDPAGAVASIDRANRNAMAVINEMLQNDPPPRMACLGHADSLARTWSEALTP
ncbi:hypothetical protein [Stenotrophomonas sp. PS02301]|uniref:hypothetical protein n=1 Tax=Stenotrophomonas sp. PS02301 TaxID=2991427 RepID=UPI00249CB1FD|nr:hypothetical protein [Stenotrophomonas sp. PS02301]